MTEKEWLAGTDPERMLKYLQSRRLNGYRNGRRRLRLVGCACARRAEPYLTKRGWRWVDLGEQIADDLLKFAERKRVEAELTGTMDGQRPDHWADGAAHFTTASTIMFAVRAAAQGAAQAFGTAAWLQSRDEVAGGEAERAEREVQAKLVRDIFPNPFRPLPFHPTSFSPEWRTSTAVALARQMYESRDFGAMPILADALQDAGCDNDEVLSHCRGPGPHVRGCWVVDLVLGK
jgi:hypothetical protein